MEVAGPNDTKLTKAQVAAGAELRDGDPLRLLVRLRARLAKPER